MNFRIVENKSKSEFAPEWYCDNQTACNHGWNCVHTSGLMSTPSETYGAAVKRIEWFAECFSVDIEEITHQIKEK